MQINEQKNANICKIQKIVVNLRVFEDEEDIIHITTVRAVRTTVHGSGSGCESAHQYIRYSGGR